MPFSWDYEDYDSYEDYEAEGSGKGDPFKPVKEWGSKARKKEAKDKRGANKRKAIKEQTQGAVSALHWETTALQHPTIECPDDYKCPDELDPEDDHALTAGFVAAQKICAQNGISDPISELPSAPQGAAERAKVKRAGTAGGQNPTSTLDLFNWDAMPLPGMGQIK